MNSKMEQSNDPVVYKNVSLWRACENLYLDSRTADVRFLLTTDDGETVKIPAHKYILSATSPVFDAMFYGELKEPGDITIADTPPEVFKEFLQFFYLGTVKVTAENVAEVMNLAKHYMLSECFSVCANFSKDVLTMDTMCLGYELAILFEDDDLKKFCEQQISGNADKVFRSQSFLNCKPNVLRRILQLNSLKCDESVVFDGCIAWAKAACIRKGLDEKVDGNLRAQLGDLFYEIRFGEMRVEQFYARHLLYGGMFSMDQLKCVMGMIASKEYPSGKFNRSPRTISIPADAVFVCNRVDPIESYSAECYSKESVKEDTTIFSANTTLLLTQMHFSDFTGSSKEKLRAFVQVWALHSYGHAFGKRYYVKELVHDSTGVPINEKGETIIKLHKPIVIKENMKYLVKFNVVQCDPFSIVLKNFLAHKPEVQMDHGIVVTFHDGTDGIDTCKKFGLLKQMHFQKYTG